MAKRIGKYLLIVAWQNNWCFANWSGNSAIVIRIPFVLFIWARID